MYAEIKTLIGKTVESCSKDGDMITIKTTDGCKLQIYHEQDCCESVVIHSCGDLNSLVGKVVEAASEKAVDAPRGLDKHRYIESETWTEQRINRVKILWHGQSNGYYGETPSTYLDETEKTVDLSEDLKSDNSNLKPTIEARR